jgi:hypothetical protein
MQQQFRWWHKGDLDGFLGLFAEKGENFRNSLSFRMTAA